MSLKNPTSIKPEFLILFIAVIAIGLFLLATLINNKSNQNTTTNTPDPSPLVQYKQPTEIKPTQMNGITTFSDTAINITFKYPAAFYIYKYDMSDRTDASFSADFKNTQINQPVNENNLIIGVTALNNPQNLALSEFLQDYYSQLPTVQPSVSVYDSLKDSLEPTATPQQGSLRFTGQWGENPTKVVFFANKDKVYIFSLIGGAGTGEKYNAAAEKTFDQLISSITLD